MSATNSIKRITVPDIRARKGGERIVALTSYSALTAKIVDPHADMILVGDSVCMVEHGMSTTLGATLDMMALHGASVMRGSARALVVVDLPFGSYEEGPQVAFQSAARLMSQTGCSAVKLEGGATMAETVRFLTQRGVPVVAHIGLMPQAMMQMGGFKTQGRDPSTWSKIIADAEAVSAAGAFCVVLEGMVEPLAAQITKSVPIPTIGIGASRECDGQILVLEDMLGLNRSVPRFVRKFAGLGAAAEEAIVDYARAVRSGAFPSDEETYPLELQ